MIITYVNVWMELLTAVYGLVRHKMYVTNKKKSENTQQLNASSIEIDPDEQTLSSK